MKPKREITLGEMKDECDLLYSNKTPCTECTYKDVCSFHQCGGMCHIDLTDPPRFTEAQMALLRALWDMGARTVRSGYTTDVCARADDERGKLLFAWVGKSVGLTLQLGETLDLAELFGKEGTK